MWTNNQPKGRRNSYFPNGTISETEYRPWSSARINDGARPREMSSVLSVLGSQHREAPQHPSKRRKNMSRGKHDCWLCAKCLLQVYCDQLAGFQGCTAHFGHAISCSASERPAPLSSSTSQRASSTSPAHSWVVCLNTSSALGGRMRRREPYGVVDPGIQKQPRSCHLLRRTQEQFHILTTNREP